VHSILPRPFAYRRPQLRITGRGAMQREKIHLPYRSVLATLVRRQDELPRQSVLDMMQQQQLRLEYSEAALMSAEDEYEQNWVVGSCNTIPLRNPWLLLCQPQAEEQTGNTSVARRTLVRFKTTEEVEADLMHATRPIATLAFLYVDVANLNAIARAVEPAMLKRVRDHYNYIVQNALRSFDCFVAKTNSVTAYLVVFKEAAYALEAARHIQLELVQSCWPVELRPLEATLQVKDPKTNTVLFNGPRAQMAVHVSDQYTWRPVPVSGTNMKSSSGGGASDSANTGSLTPNLSAIHISGVGVDEAFILGRHAYGGEIRLSRPLLEAVGRHPSGKLLLEQLSMEVVVAPSVIRLAEDATSARAGSAEGLATDKTDKSKTMKTNMFSEECVASVPRRLHGRLALMLPPGTSEKAGSVFKSPEEHPAGSNTTATTRDRGGSSGIMRKSNSASNVKGKTKTGQAGGEAVAEEPQVITSIATGGTSSMPSSASSALAKATPLLSVLSPQNSWIKDPRESSNVLPAAAATNWGSDEEQVSACLIAAGIHNEAKQIQKVMQSVLKLFPPQRRRSLSLSLEAASEGSISELPTLNSISSPLTLITDGEGNDGDDASGVRRDGKSPRPSIDARSSALRRRSSKEDTAGSVMSKFASGGGKRSIASADVSRRSAVPTSTLGQYSRFLDFSRYIISMLVNALEIGTEQRAPPPLPLPSSSTGDDVSGGTAGAAAGTGGSGTFKDGRGTSALVAGRAKSGQSGSLSLPPVPSPPGRISGKALGIASSSAGSRQPSVSSKAGDVALKAFTVNRDKPFQSALDYIDEACRSLIQTPCTDASRLPAIPAAPPSKSKSFSGRSTSRRH
jgi:hypothetical protein